MTTPALDAELAKPVAAVFAALEIAAPTFTLRLLDGASEVTFPVEDAVTGIAAPATFKGSDPVLGTLGTLRSMSEGVGTEAPRLRLELRPPTRAAAATLNLPTNQGALVRMWFGAVSLLDGAVIEPSLEFLGNCDVPKYLGGRGRRVEFDVYSPWEALFAEAEGDRLNHENHTRAFPLERGLEYISDVERQLPWGADVPKSPMISNAQGSGGGGASIPGGGGGVLGRGDILAYLAGRFTG